MYLSFGAEQYSLGDDEALVLAVFLAERFGWTLDYIEAMPYSQYIAVLATLDGRALRDRVKNA